MRPIEMVDLKSQHNRLQPHLNNTILDVVASSVYIKGAEVSMFEEELAAKLDVKHVIACANGTDALQLALMALELKPGDEVITSNFTYVATAEIIALLQLKPVLVDVDPETFEIDLNEVVKAIGPKTKAIVPVHLFGQCCNMEGLMQIAKEHKLYVVEDTAQAINADFYFTNGSSMKAGTIGDIGTTSFFPSKNLGCMGDGGAIFTNNDELALKLRMIANHGQSKQYYHDLVGVNSRLDSIQAAILRIKLPHLDEYCQKRQEAAAIYDDLLKDEPGIVCPVRSTKSSHVFHQYVVKVVGASRDALKAFLNSKSIPCNIYYPVPLNKQKAYLDESRTFKHTDKLCEIVLALPMHTELDLEQQKYIVTEIKKFLKDEN
ncbi:MAG: DegT/DnrJ/EryC1/StrS family aminotransferase [Chitinophagales bacterium]|nr:DegT/DnrJ/EryC1/StrS family aminotransferase [Chitinophagales bacterium]